MFIKTKNEQRGKCFPINLLALAIENAYNIDGV